MCAVTAAAIAIVISMILTSLKIAKSYRKQSRNIKRNNQQINNAMEENKKFATYKEFGKMLWEVVYRMLTFNLK